MKRCLRARFGQVPGWRRVLAVLGAALSMASIALVIVSCFGSGFWLTGSRIIGLRPGGVALRYTGIELNGTHWEWHPPDNWCWMPRSAMGSSPATSDFDLPLWCPCLIGVFFMLPAYSRLRRQRAGHICSLCGYDLTGIDGVCPECGDER